MGKTKPFEQQDYNPLQIKEKPSPYAEAHKLIARQLADPKDTTALDAREMLTKTPKGIVLELSVLSAIGDILRWDDDLIKKYEESEIKFQKELETVLKDPEAQKWSEEELRAKVKEKGIVRDYPYEKMEIEAAEKFAGSIQTHLYQNFMSEDGWRAIQIKELGESEAISEGLRQKREEGIRERFFNWIGGK